MAKRTQVGGTVLCATDLTETSDEALRQAYAAARGQKARLVVLHVLPDPLRPHPLLPLVASRQHYARLPEAHARAGAEMRTQLERTIGRDVSDVKLQIEHGIPHVVIVESAETRRADLIVVGGSSSRVGHEAQRVVRYAHAPVLVARPSPPAGAVLAATDLSDAALPAVKAGVGYARRHRKPLALLHVVDVRPMMVQADFGAVAATALTDEIRESLLEAGATGSDARFGAFARQATSSWKPATPRRSSSRRPRVCQQPCSCSGPPERQG